MLDYGISMVIAVAIGTLVILGGIYTLRWVQAVILLRLSVGLVALVAGVWLGYPLVTGDTHPLNLPYLLGTAAGLIGLGINQVVAPMRAAAGGAA